MDTIKSLAYKLLAIPMTLFAIIFAIEKLEYLPETDLFFLRQLVLVLFSFGVVLYIFWGAAKLWGTTEYNFDIERMKSGQMDLSILLSNKLFPVIPTKRQLKNIYKVNNAVCKLQYRTIKFLGLDISKYTGICSVIPMTEDARDLLEKENINGLSFTSTHIASPKYNHSCSYIGAVGATGLRAKKHILIFLSGLISNSFENGVEIFFTRPTTKDGLRVSKQFGFVPVMNDVGENELNRLYRLDKQDYNEIH